MPVFEFVDSDDPTARRRAKSHLARQTHRERRLREIEVYQSRRQALATLSHNIEHNGDPPPAAPKLERPIKQWPVLAVLQPPHPDQELGILSPESENNPDEHDQKMESSGRQTWLDTFASRVAARPNDTFWSVYSHLSSGDRSLLQWYLVAVPELSFRITETSPTNPMRDWVFPLVGESSAVLNSSLMIAAANNPVFSQGEEGISRVLMQKGRTIGLINRALQGRTTVLEDDILYAVASMAITEDRLGDQMSCRVHLDGLKNMIRLRGGIRSLRKNRPLCGAIVWAEVSVSNYTAPVVHSQDDNETCCGPKTSTLSILEARYEQELFCQFLIKLQQVQLSRRRSHVPTDSHPLGQTDSLFRKGSSLMAMLGEADLDSGVITPISRMNANNCQVACLLYINFMLCKSYGSSQLTAAFLARLSALVRKHGGNKLPRAGLFVWVFLREMEQVDTGIGEIDPLEWLIRMIRVVRRLTPESSQIFHHVLLESLKTHEATCTGLGFIALGVALEKVEAFAAISPTLLHLENSHTKLTTETLIANESGCVVHGTDQYFNTMKLLQEGKFRPNVSEIVLVGSLMVIRNEESG